ncbi:MAG: hypothetical protein R6U10_02435 [Thermoplasmatota archaeon]
MSHREKQRYDKMKGKILGVYVAAALMIAGFAGVAVAQGPSHQAGHSTVAHLNLYEKNPDTWEIVEDGAWGKMTYNTEGPTFNFVFNGHGLEAGEDYTLIYYPDPWPGEGLICLGSGTANEDGDVHIMNAVDTGDLPKDPDENDEAKIWLVLSEDVDCQEQKMTGWNPTEYLFEEKMISYEDTGTSNGPGPNFGLL